LGDWVIGHPFSEDVLRLISRDESGLPITSKGGATVDKKEDPTSPETIGRRGLIVGGMAGLAALGASALPNQLQASEAQGQGEEKDNQRQIDLGQSKTEIIRFKLTKEDLANISRVVTRLQVTSGAGIAEPGAFTIRNHSFSTTEPGAFTIRNHNFSIKAPGAYTIRNYQFSSK